MRIPCCEAVASALFDPGDRAVVELSAASLIQLLDSELNVSLKVFETIRFFQQAQGFPDHLTGRSVAP
jgi:hypothetical protein